jgi:hypothetical protein
MRICLLAALGPDITIPEKEKQGSGTGRQP